MPRGRRVLVEGGLYHVYNRFARGEDVFADPEEAIEFAELLREVKRRDGLTVLAWALLSNHYHLAVRTSAIPLSRSMQRLQGGFARGFNRRWKRSGPLWQSRYQARVIDSQEYLERVIIYIHLNPVCAGLVQNPVDYVFCGHRELVKKTRDPLTDGDHALISFGGSLNEARKQYRARIRTGLDQEPSEKWQTIFGLLGPRDRDLEAPVEVSIDMLGRSTGLERPAVDPVRFVKAVCSILGVEVEVLASTRRDRKTAELRKLVAAVAVERWGQKAGRLAKLLNKHPVAVSRWVAEAARRRTEDPGFSRQMDGLDEALSDWALEAYARGEFAIDPPSED
jgi:putative transposase